MKKVRLPICLFAVIRAVFPFSFLVFNFELTSSAQYASQNMTLLFHWDTAATIAEPIYNIRYNSVWGWTDPQDSSAYAIIGSSDGTYFFDVSVPTAPVLKDYVAGRRDSCIWREYKTYQKYLYAVSDDGVSAINQNSLQITDLSYLPDSVHVVYDTDTLFMRAHTIFIDGNKMYCGYVNTPSAGYSMAVYSLANPEAPAFLRSLNQDDPAIGVVHDMYVRNDTVYASCGNDGLHIYKFTAGNTFVKIGSLTNYANYGQGYNHSSALTENGKTLVFADEVPANLALKSVDVSDLGNITVLDTFRSTYPTIATPHNPFIRKGSNSNVVVAYYQDGVQSFDISNPSNVTRTGFFDTAPNNCPTCPNANYSGCWGAYVDLPSGILLASDMQNGLFVLKNCNISASYSVIPVSCFGGNDGSASVNITTSEPAPYSYQWGNGQTTTSVSGLKTGIHSVTVTASSGCTNVFNIPVPGAPMIISNLVYTPASCSTCPDGSAQTNIIGGTPPYAFQWNTGETTYNIIGLFAGTYIVCVTDAKGCTECDTINVGVVGTNEMNAELSINIFPNPSGDDFMISILLMHEQKLKLSVLDITSRLIELKEEILPAGNSSVKISGKSLCPGTYFLKIEGEEAKQIKKLIKLY